MRKERCFKCICEQCNVDHPDKRTDVIDCWRDFEWHWTIEEVAVCPVSLVEGFNYKEHGDLAPINKPYPIWCPYYQE